MANPTHVCTFIEGNDQTRAPLVLLHGSDGTESDLLATADRIAPGAATVGIRGTVITNDGYAFFHRHADRRVDEHDLAQRAPVLASIIHGLGDRPGFDRPPIAIGFSNGAIMAAAVLTTQPGTLAGAILFRPLAPFSDERSHHLDQTPVLIIDGAFDQRRSRGDGRRLATQLTRAGATVTHRELRTGHDLTAADEELARRWLKARLG